MVAVRDRGGEPEEVQDSGAARVHPKVRKTLPRDAAEAFRRQPAFADLEEREEQSLGGERAVQAADR